jgi:hypothetical protein
MAPIVTRTKATSEIGPYDARALGSAKAPVSMTDPTTRAEAEARPNPPPAGAAVLGTEVGVADVVTMSASFRRTSRRRKRR